MLDSFKLFLKDNEILKYLNNLPENQRVLLDKGKVNFTIRKVLENREIQIIKLLLIFHSSNYGKLS